MASFREFWSSARRPSQNGYRPYAFGAPRLATPPLPERDPDGLDVPRSSIASDWNGAAPRSETAPADELRMTDGVRMTDEPTSTDGAGVANGVHAITKSTDYWFERELHEIEKIARRQAEEWAHKGLPRHDVTRTEPLEPEQVLNAHCAQLFRDWQRRVRTKMQDAIEEGSQAVGRQVATLRNSITRLEAIRSENAELAERVTRLRVEAERDAVKPVRYDRYIGGGLFWPGAIILAAVEFFANFPVFRLMLPMSRALSTAAQTAGDEVNDTSLLAGPEMLLREMLLHFEATVVALVAVVVLVLLGKTLGGALRPLAAFKPEDHPLATQTIRSHRRQQGVLAGVSALGIVCVLSFLYLSRGSIAQLAGERVQAERHHLAALRDEASRTTDRAKITQATMRVYSSEQNLIQLQDDAQYAMTVQQNNLPILGLNVALILTALVLGFSYKSEDLNDKRGEHPEIVAARERMSQLDREMFAVLGEGRQAEAQAHAEIARVHHLLRASPLRDWRSKLGRLDGVIPLFRGDNARLRGLDPANIRAFDLPADLRLPPVEDDESFQEPNEFARLTQEFNALGTEFGRLAPRMTPALGNPIIS